MKLSEELKRREGGIMTKKQPEEFDLEADADNWIVTSKEGEDCSDAYKAGFAKAQELQKAEREKQSKIVAKAQAFRKAFDEWSSSSDVFLSYECIDIAGELIEALDEATADGE